MQPHEEKKHSVWPVALVAGLAAGLAAGLFINSDKGHQMTDEAKKRAKILQKDLAKKLKGVKKLTKEKYEEIVGELIEHYRDTKDMASDQLDQLKQRLMDQWDEIREHFENDEEE